jgi:membrane protease YdiL (CAAX protease family)
MFALGTPLDDLLLAIASIGIPAWSLFGGRWYARRTHGSRSARYWLIAIRGVALSVLVIVAWRQAGRPLSMLGLDLPVGIPGRVGFLIDIPIVGYYLASIQFRRRSRDHLAAARDRLRRLGTYDMLPQTTGEFAVYPIAAVAGSAFEELLYRGFLIGGLTPVLGAAGAVAMSSLLFGLGHLYQGRIGVVRTAVIGLAFGVAFTLTHSLWWLLIAHAAANLSGILLARRILSESPESECTEA